MAVAQTERIDGRQERWAEHKRARRQAILEAALEVIGETAPGEEIHARQIANRAGLSRTVLYRHFEDRADLDRAVQGLILQRVREALGPAIELQGSPRAIIHRVVGAYVVWASENPALHRFAEAGATPDAVTPSELDRSVGQIASQVEELLRLGVDVLGVELDDAAAQGLDPLVFGLVGAVFNSVRRWLARPVVEPSREAFVELLAESVWYQIHGLVAARGLELDPDIPIEELLAAE